MTFWRITTTFDDTPLVRGGGVNHMHYDGDSDPTDAQSAVAAFWTELIARSHTSVTGTVSNQVGAYLDDGTLVFVTPLGDPVDLVGGSSGDPLPPATQGLIEWTTGAVVGRRILRGRTFLPGMTEQYSTSGIPTAEFKGFINTAIGNFGAAADGFAIWSPTHDTFKTVTEGHCWAEWAVLRSRRD